MCNSTESGGTKNVLGEVGLGLTWHMFNPSKFNPSIIDPYSTRPYSTHNPYQPSQTQPKVPNRPFATSTYNKFTDVFFLSTWKFQYLAGLTACRLKTGYLPLSIDLICTGFAATSHIGYHQPRSTAKRVKTAICSGRSSTPHWVFWQE